MVAHDALFDSAWSKWWWAFRHAEAFEADLHRVARDPDSQQVMTVRTEYHPKRHAFAVVVDSISEFPPEWGLQLGDIAFNYRCALDHLAWAVVRRGKNPPSTLKDSQRRQISFPITDSSQAFTTAVTGCEPGRKKADRPIRLPGARRGDIAILRRHQPHHWGSGRMARDPLTILARLNNHDKHRQVQPALLHPTGGVVQILDVQDAIVTRMPTKARTVPVKLQAEICAIGVRKNGPNPQMQVQAGLATQVGLEDGISIPEWMDKTRNRIAGLLLEFSQPPAHVHDALARIKS